MHYSLAYQLGERSGGLDPDAKAYIAAVETAGATVSGGQKKAINTFVKTGKSDGWYSSIKRLYLPIWASASPNAIDMIALGSGTFNGTVTHSAGYVQGDGATGYFVMTGAVSSGLTTSSNGLFVLQLTAPSGTGLVGLVGNRNSPSQALQLSRINSTTLRYDTCESSFNSLSATLTLADTVGIFSGQRVGTAVNINRRTGSGITSLGSATVAVGGTLPTVELRAMGSVWDNNDGRIGLFGASLGLTVSQDELFTLALKTLWETSTGLTLP
jgi:hypothetical protein